MFDFGCADPKAKRTVSPIGGGMAVATGNQHAGRDEPLFRHHNVLDTLSWVAKTVKGDAVFGAVCLQVVDQKFGCRVMRLTASGCVDMINHGQMRLGSPNFQALCVEP